MVENLLQVHHSTLGRAKLRRVQCPASSRHSKSFDELDTVKEADWLLDDDDDVFEDEEEDGYAEEDEGPGVSGRLQVSKDVVSLLQAWSAALAKGFPM